MISIFKFSKEMEKFNNLSFSDKVKYVNNFNNPLNILGCILFISFLLYPFIILMMILLDVHIIYTTIFLPFIMTIICSLFEKSNYYQFIINLIKLKH